MEQHYARPFCQGTVCTFGPYAARTIVFCLPMAMTGWAGQAGRYFHPLATACTVAAQQPSLAENEAVAITCRAGDVPALAADRTEGIGFDRGDRGALEQRIEVKTTTTPGTESHANLLPPVKTGT